MPRKYKKKNKGSCNMIYESAHNPPCQGQGLSLHTGFSNQTGGFLDNYQDASMGCTSYNVNVGGEQIAGMPIISGNPDNCLETQMGDISSFNPQTKQVGGNAACAGVGFDLSQPIAGRATVYNYSPNCLYPETSGGGKKKRARGKNSNSKKKKKTKKKVIVDIINKVCKEKKLKCSKKVKEQIYNKVFDKLCK